MRTLETRGDVKANYSESCLFYLAIDSSWRQYSKDTNPDNLPEYGSTSSKKSQSTTKVCQLPMTLTFSPHIKTHRCVLMVEGGAPDYRSAAAKGIGDV